ncbi:protein-glutamate O-methyltransferase CheR [Geobacter sp. AOG1]|uniref:CheR family methyltransferase n=1 Tax=Geobacter sp. AOG1 TaxID=1566346 RepID=UPI001CC66F4C|nr:protein-glutamate O-methyltransferase [Geobacter sp. AOG1]
MRLTGGDFLRLAQFIYDACGIRMPPSKKSMLESRLQKRLRALGMDSFSQYCAYLFSPEGQKHEVIGMIDLVTTNKTDFFREPDHFAYLTEHLLPEWVRRHPDGTRPFRVWSAGCSTGEEPYTLAMVLQDFADRCPGFDFRIMATDISTRVLEAGRQAVYREERTATVPLPFKKKFLLRSKDRNEGLVRIIPGLRNKVQFRWLNFTGTDFGIHETFDVIFCRNVIIYFDRATQETLLERFRSYLAVNGHLFLGHSETLSGYNLPLKAVYPTVYRNIR